MATKALFESKEIVKSYSEYRPHYSQQVADHVLDELKKASPSKTTFDLMVEVGCGSGQATNLFAPYFHKVLATDISQEQIKSARQKNKFQHVSYNIGKAEKVNAEDGSVDLLVSAQSAHWFNLKEFYSEASRIIKPNGCLALIGYGCPNIKPSVNKMYAEDVTSLLDESFLEIAGEDKPVYLEIGSKYSEICAEIPSTKIIRFSVKQAYDWSLTYLRGFYHSIGIYQKHMKKIREELQAQRGNQSVKNDRSIDVAEVFVEKLKRKLDLASLNDDEIKITAEFEVFIIVAHSLSQIG